MNSLIINCLLQLLAIPNMCSIGSVVVHKFCTLLCITRNTPPTHAVQKLFNDFSCISFNEENHIKELRSIVILSSEQMLSPSNART